MGAERSRPGALSPQEREVVARREAGQSATVIAEALRIDRNHVYTILSRARRKGVLARTPERASRAGEDTRPRAELAARVCIRCSHPFMSEGRHNRMCGDCRGFAAGLAPQFIGA